MQKLNTAAQMRQMDQTAMHGIYAIAPAVLMENAGHAVAERSSQYIGGWEGKDVIILCGKGNNGGDGFVIARHILGAGARVYVYVLGDPDGYSAESQAHLQTLKALADGDTCRITRFVPSDQAWALLRRRLASCQIAVDAMLGTGFHGSLRAPYSEVVSLVNEMAATGTLQVISVDMPTGVNADTGAVSGEGEDENGPLFADMTVTFGALKRGLVLYPGRTCAGHVELDAIGMPLPLLVQPEEDAAYMLQESDIAELLTPRSPDSHKGTHGVIAIAAGCSDMAGAALMSAHGAVRSGGGKVFLRVPSQAAPYCIGRQPEIMVKGVGQTFFTGHDAQELLAESRNWTVLAIGPGLGRQEETKDFVKQMIAGTSCPVVVDADALNLLAGERDFAAAHGGRLVFTPHDAEFSRLSGWTLKRIQEDRLAAAKEFVRQWQVNLVLKGAPTIIVSARTGNAYVNPTGNAGMACGGMGDVLTGMIAAIAAREGRPDLCSAACAAVYLHGAAGDACSRSYGPYGFTPMEVADEVPKVIQHLEGQRANLVLQKPMIGDDEHELA
ncbi:NAD(P)H-hydrate dehydratase [uncultured Megasphaera sp.]|uniref:NAD(P)H-hydrate dehydratase n=1 Tax=uncultured Megasphaera sp. TaxID=165188 RepID=UPI00265968DE|nr:NAD(P)H-hydrate dehydratase [uncultured Megasphaera sp.]